MITKMSKKTYYQDQTLHALENFPFALPPVQLEIVYAIVTVKKATAIANEKTKRIPKNILHGILQACEEILSGKFDDQFVTCSLQGGAGTSMHMNVNEVIASRAEELLTNGLKTHVHPNDHVNSSQSTNDVNPSALKLASITLTNKLLLRLIILEKTLKKRAKENKTVLKLARTHIQDAVPTTIGAEFFSYAAIIERDRKRIEKTLKNFYELNLGGTAIGNSINASKEYIREAYKALYQITHIPFRPAKNFMSQTSASSDFVELSSAITICALDLSKIAADIRFMASGPNGGIGEITLPPLQKGSSIMPGKINPVIPESVNQMYYFVLGKDMTIREAAHNASLELGIMFPILADSLITMIKVTDTAVDIFTRKCIGILQVNKERCKELLENSTAYATLLNTSLGYDKMTQLVKEAHEKKSPFKTLLKTNNVITEEKLYALLASL